MNILTHEQVATIRSHYCLNDQADVSLRALCDSHELLRGTVAAQDGREKAAGDKCRISWVESGCDWPDYVADSVLELRHQLDVAMERIAVQSELLSKKSERAEA